MKALIIGASAGLGRALAERLARDGWALRLLASDIQDLDPLCRDLALRYGIDVLPIVTDLAAPDLSQIHAAVLDDAQGLDALFCVAGLSDPPRDKGAIEDAFAKRLLDVNFTSMVRLVNLFLPDLAERGGNIVGIGSVASIRPRRQNAVYGAAKTGLEFYFGTLRHYFGDGGCAVRYYRMGFLKTSMTFGQKLPLPALEPTAAAEILVADLDKRQGVRYLPGWWAWVALVLRAVPWPVFKKLNI